MSAENLWTLALAGIENFILINTFLSIGIFIVILSIRGAGLMKRRQPQTQERIYTAGLVMPTLIASWLVAGSLLPVFWLGLQRWTEEHHAAHELHLLNAFTAAFDPALGYAALVFISITAMVAIYTAASAYFRLNGIVRQLEIGDEPVDADCIEQVKASCQKHGLEVGLVVSRYPFSFVWGYLRSKLIVSTGLLNVLNADELAALLEHEIAHHHRRDNLSKWVLTICRYTSPAFPFNGMLYRWRNAQVEMICDEIAAQRTQTPIAVAGALVRLKRLIGRLQPRPFQPMESGFFGEEMESFEHRVSRLLSLSDDLKLNNESLNRSLKHSWISSASIIVTIFIVSLLMMFMISPLAIHRAMETLLHI